MKLSELEIIDTLKISDIYMKTMEHIISIDSNAKLKYFEIALLKNNSIAIIVYFSIKNKTDVGFYLLK